MGRQPETPERDEDLAQVFKGHGPCTYLLLSLLALILVYPYLPSNLVGRVSLGAMYSMVLLGGAYATSRNSRALILIFGLAAVGVALQWLGIATQAIAVTQLAAATYAAFLVIAIGEVLRYILRRGPLTADKLHGAFAGYIMLGFLWAFLYALIESFRPGSFAPGDFDLRRPGVFFRLLYFSFTTLTTTGFGDVTPVTDQARSLVIIEEFTGVFFVGVLVARLAGLYPPRRR